MEFVLIIECQLLLLGPYSRGDVAWMSNVVRLPLSIDLTILV